MPMGSNRANRVRRLTRVLAAGVVVGSLTSAHAQTPAPRPGVLAIENDTVIPMDRGRAIAGQTVLVRDGRIVSVEPSARARIPSGATRVNGAGKYLIPGLADMHAHLFAD
jgi:imidazolonepropionase-like amidohydrolase